MTVVDVLDMEFATNAFYGRPVECLMADTRGGGTWWIAGITVAHQQCILVHDQREGLPRDIGVDRGQNGTDGRAGAVCGTACKIDPSIGVIGVQKCPP